MNYQKNIKLDIGTKYAFLYDENDEQINYWEHFSGKESSKIMLKLSCLDDKGKKFIKKNHQKVLDIVVYWFGRKTSYKPVFINSIRGFDYLFLVK